jgi:formiminotetrahydrofolate cyclodeaminase
MLKTRSVADFCNALASSDPTPGGGSGAAAAGALGASLLAMVAGRTLDRDEAAPVEKEVRELHGRALKLQSKLLDLIDQDTQAYNEVVAAARLPKQTDTEKERRREALQKAYLFASEVPLTTAEACLAVLSGACSLVLRAPRQLASDLATGVLLAHAGVYAAILNIEANLPYVRDPGVATKLKERSAPLRGRADSMRDEVTRNLAARTRPE